MVDVSQLIKQREAKFVEARTKAELEINKFLESIKPIEDELKDIPGRPAGTCAKEIVPALWTEPFDEAAYYQQLEVFNNYVNQVVAYGDKVNEEALRCLQTSQ